MSITVDVLDPRHDPRPADYEPFLAEHDMSPLWDYDLLRIASWSSWTPVLVSIVRDAGEMVGLVCAVTMMPHRRGRFAPVTGGGMPRIVDVRQPGNGFEPSWHFVPGADRARLLRAFEKAATRRLGPSCLGVVYRLAWESDLPSLRERRPGPFPRPVVKAPGCAVQELPETYEAWLGSLPQRRRTELRRQRRRLAEDPDLVVTFDFGRTDIDAEAVADLFRAQDTRLRGGKMPRYQPPATYRRLMAARKDVGTLTYHDRAGRLLACSALIVRSESVVGGPWGAVPVEAGGRRHLYFDMHCRFVEWAIANARRTFNDGRGRLDVKQELGFKEVPMYAVPAPRWVS